MWTLPHDDTYIVDSNLVMFYMTGRFPTWVKFIRDHDALGTVNLAKQCALS